MGGSDHTISLEFRVPSDLDDDFNVYRHTAKLEFYSNRKPQYRAPPVNNMTGKAPSDRLINSQDGLPKTEGDRPMFLFDKQSETPVSVSKFPYANKNGGKNKSYQHNRNVKTHEGASRPKNKDPNSVEDGNGHNLFTVQNAMLSKMNSELVVPYKFNPQPILKAYPGKDPGNLRITTNSRSATTLSQSSDYFELVPNDQINPDLLKSDQTGGRPGAGGAATAGLKSAQISASKINGSGDQSVGEMNYLPYPLLQHSYVTPQPPWVNKVKLRKAKEHVTQIMSSPSKSSAQLQNYSLSPVPPANSTIPPVSEGPHPGEGE